MFEFRVRSQDFKSSEDGEDKDDDLDAPDNRDGMLLKSTERRGSDHVDVMFMSLARDVRDHDVIYTAQ